MKMENEISCTLKENRVSLVKYTVNLTLTIKGFSRVISKDTIYFYEFLAVKRISILNHLLCLLDDKLS